ncbi:MAG: oligosaccharide flippase family protein [Deltaproteobacteria bacterium]|nr:oligosaccharide flippase family protein [Deltaproteobacteria bacterium]
MSNSSSQPGAAGEGRPTPSREAGDAVLRRGVHGAAALGVRQVLVQLLSVAGAIALANLLTPAQFGVYAVTVFVMHFLVAFGDAGLAASLVREPDEPCDRDYHAVFTAQQILVAVVVLCGVVAAPALEAALGRQTDLGPLIPAALAALAITSFQTLPAARLERHLRFDRLAVVEVVQALAFNGVAVACALAGLGAAAMSVALVARAAAGAVTIAMVEPWRLTWVLDWPLVRRRLRFGLPFQAAALVNLVRESLLPVMVGAVLGAAAVGGIFWAHMFATAPLIVVAMLQRLLLPMFARLQGNPRELRRACEASVFAIAALVIPVQTAAWALQEPITRIVFGAQWLEWLPVYRLVWIAVVLEAQLVVAMALLNALGRAGRIFGYLAALAVGLWVGGVPLLLALGPAGYGIATILLLAIKQRLIREADTAAGTNSLHVVAPVWAASLLSGVVTSALAALVQPQGPVALVAVALMAALAYLALLSLLARTRTRSAVDWMRREWQRA